MLPPGPLVNAIRSALAFVILRECFASILSLATPDEMPKADKATIKITERRKSLGFMIQVRLIREYRSGRFWCKPGKHGVHAIEFGIIQRSIWLRRRHIYSTIVQPQLDG